MILVVVQEPIYVIKLQRALYQNQRAHIKTDVLDYGLYFDKNVINVILLIFMIIILIYIYIL